MRRSSAAACPELRVLVQPIVIRCVRQRAQGRKPPGACVWSPLRLSPQGVTGIGPKGAVQLLTEHGDLEGVWRAALEGAAGGIAPKRRAALQVGS